MSDKEITRAQAQAVAWFIHDAVRPDWDEAGIVKALYDARGKAGAGTVARAAIAAAQNADNRTPGVIPLSGPHWAVAGPVAVNRKPPPRSQTCGICYLGHDECRRRWHWDHDFESIADTRNRAIADAEGVPRHLRRPPVQVMGGRPINDVELP